MSSAQTPGAPRPLPPGPTIVLAATVATLVIVVIRPFVVPVLWALLLAYVTWPVYRWLMRRWRRRAGFAAFALTVGVAAAIVAPMIAIVSLAHEEVIDAYRTAVRSAAANQDEIVAAVRAIPWIGPSLAEYWHNVAPDSPVARAYTDLLAHQKKAATLGLLIVEPCPASDAPATTSSSCCSHC